MIGFDLVDLLQPGFGFGDGIFAVYDVLLAESATISAQADLTAAAIALISFFVCLTRLVRVQITAISTICGRWNSESRRPVAAQAASSTRHRRITPMPAIPNSIGASR